MGGVSPRCGIEQIRKGHTLTQSGQFLLGVDLFLPQILLQ